MACRREIGFYWVKRSGILLVAEWRGDGEFWYLPGIEGCFFDDSFSFINENKIKE